MTIENPGIIRVKGISDLLARFEDTFVTGVELSAREFSAEERAQNTRENWGIPVFANGQVFAIVSLTGTDSVELVRNALPRLHRPE